MMLSLSQAAERLGKTRRQIRYMIQQGRLDARKDGGRWTVDSEQLPLNEEQLASRLRQETRLRDAVDTALDTRRKGRYRLRDLKVTAVGIPLYQQCLGLLGPDCVAVSELRLALDYLAIGYHRYSPTDKREAYRAARDAAARAAMALLLSDQATALELPPGCRVLFSLGGPGAAPVSLVPQTT